MPSNKKQSQHPDGFTRVKWNQVSANQLVYVSSVKEGKSFALGPFIVVDNEARTIRRYDSESLFTHTKENLYYKDGPPVVITLNDGKVVACYADIPLDVVILEQDLTKAYCNRRRTRPKTPEALPSDQQKILNKDLNGLLLAGSWEVTKLSTVAADENNNFSFTVGNRLALVALISELTRHGKKFSYHREKDEDIITVAPSVLHFIRQTASQVLGEPQ